MHTFHEGELALQERAGIGSRLAEIGPRVIRDHMPQQHRDFFALLPFLIAGTVDSQGQPWASVLVGEPGFVSSRDAGRLRVKARPLPHDPLEHTLVDGAAIGLLGIEPHTRRRNRLNGRVVQRRAGEFDVEVSQSFGNCPKYIQARQASFTAGGEPAGTAQQMRGLEEAAIAMVRRADTFFIATAHPQAGGGDEPAFGVDVSHRGGKPGFVRVDVVATDGGGEGGIVLTAPDFSGNFFFNTLGNLLLNPRCGLLFVDYEQGDLLYVAARGEIVEQAEEVSAFRGAERLVRFHVSSALRVERALPLRWSSAELSPVLAHTGAWGAATQP